MKRMNSGDSLSVFVYDRSGFAVDGLPPRCQISGKRDRTCACSFTRVMPSPPWQSVQASFTAREACIGSMPMWQLMQPVLFSSATSCRCVKSGGSVLRCCASSVAAAMAMATPVSVFFMSEGQDDVREHVIERFVSFIDVDESLPRNERRGTADDDEVLVEIRPPAQAGGEVDAELRADVALEEQRF